jgi:hypothetical protein
MIDVSDAFLEAVSTSHKPVVSVTLDGEEVEIREGQVTLDATSATRASFSATLAIGDEDLPDWVPDKPADRLAPYGNTLAVSRGIELPDGTPEMVPLGIFRIDETSVDDQGGDVTIGVTGLDCSQYLIDAVFERNGTVARGSHPAEEIQRLIDKALDGVVYAYDFFDRTADLPLLSFEAGGDRWDFCQGLAESIGCLLYFDGEGVLTLQQQPQKEAVYTITEGENLLSIGKRWGVADAVNRVVVTGENDTDTPWYGERQDDVPGSPTNYLESNFGRYTFNYSSNYVTSDDNAEQVAQNILTQKLGTGQQIDFTSLVNPALEPLDVIEVVRERIGVSELHILDSLTIPLTPGETMSCTTRVAQVVS